eukprot:COSAG02_NODE_65177_length_258_cov_1.301887_1_plen_30_part_10
MPRLKDMILCGSHFRASEERISIGIFGGLG